jgi:hypothetical protein
VERVFPRPPEGAVVSKGLGCGYRAVGSALKYVNKSNVAYRAWIATEYTSWFYSANHGLASEARSTASVSWLLDSGFWLLAPFLRSKCRWG